MLLSSRAFASICVPSSNREKKKVVSVQSGYLGITEREFLLGNRKPFFLGMRRFCFLSEASWETVTFASFFVITFLNIFYSIPANLFNLNSARKVTLHKM